MAVASRYRLQEHETGYDPPPKVEALKVTGYFFEGSNVSWKPCFSSRYASDPVTKSEFIEFCYSFFYRQERTANRSTLIFQFRKLTPTRSTISDA